MDKNPLLHQLCIELALGNVGGKRFNDLLIQTGILLDEYEWEAANKILEKSEEMTCFANPSELVMQ
ncbi:MAG: hypothetical protein HYS22_00195 [Deltaproteobacteria bacterium]|nr:hypothetical protein [Deltaproteobacteria bacterium]